MERYVQATTNDPSIGFELLRRLKQTCRLQGTTKGTPARINLSAMLLLGQSFSFHSGQFSFSFTFWLTGEMRINYLGLPSTGIVELRFGLINFLFWGPPLNVRLGNMIVFEPAGSYQDLEDSLSAEGFQLTAVAKILTHPSRIAHMRRTVMDAVMLLSFATGTYVSVAYMDAYLIDGRIASSHIWPVRVHDYHDGEPLIDNYLNSADLVRFLEMSFEPYQNLVGKLKLGFALEHCVMAKSAPIVDIGFITAFVGLESLLQRLQNQLPRETRRGGWRKIVARHLRLGRRESLVLSRLRNALTYYNLSDNAGVSQDIREDGMPNYEKIRNRLVHSGIFPKNVDPVCAYVSLIDVYQRLLLAILNYREYYIDRSRDFERRMLD